MKIFADYHTHTIYSDGKTTIQENVEQAIKIGLKTIGISDHGYKHMGFGVKYENYPKIREEIDRLQEKYKQIKILMGIECNILDDKGNIDIDDKIMSYMDYVMAGYHFGSTPKNLRGVKNHIFNYIKPLKNYEIDYNTRALINAMKNNDLFILTHPGDKGNVDIEEIAKVAKQTDTVLEINERHHNLTYEQLLKVKHFDIKYVISSDAHKKDAIGVVDDAIKRAVKAEIPINRIINVI